MSSLSAVEAQLPPGFRFHPKDEELICDYLMNWVSGSPNQNITPLLIEVDLNKCEPWDIPEAACIGGKEWYFYSQRDRKYATGLRTNRATVSGYWKATGKDRPAIKNRTLVGMRKTLVFYQGRAPKGRKTEWIMHEFRLDGNMEPDPNTFVKKDWVLCRVFYKNRSSSELATTTKQEKSLYNETCSPSLPPLMEPYTHHDITNYEHCLDYQHQAQVPCFSIFTHNQTAPNNFRPLPQIVLPSTKIMPTNFEETIMLPDNPGGIIYTSPSLINSDHEEVIIKAVLNHITKMGSCNEYPILKESPRFGEGISNSDSYLSSIWNQY